jgi:hypothetical protein
MIEQLLPVVKRSLAAGAVDAGAVDKATPRG